MKPLYKKIIAVFLVLATIVLSGFLMIPNVEVLNDCFTTKMFQVSVCPKKPTYVKLSGISRHLRNAIIVSEDGLFYSHGGFDWFELKASFKSNWRAGRFKRGGSTITQQLAKNAFLTSEKTFYRKIVEAYLTYRIEALYSKDMIFEKYLNMVEFGPKIYGIRAAANHYFHKSPSQLTPLESVYLAHLLPNPKSYSRGFQRGQLTPYSEKMVKALLKRLLQAQNISAPQYQFAISQIPSFPWGHLSLSSFENLEQFEDQQQDALEKLMQEQWLSEEVELPEDPEPEPEDF